MLKLLINRDRLKFFLILAINGSLIIATGCRHSVSANGKSRFNTESAEGNAAYINYRSFQNPDKTWGFTIFVNSMPFRHYSRIPYKRASGGFLSKDEADNAANLFVNLIRSGDPSPKLDKKSIDTLRITINKRKTPSS